MPQVMRAPPFMFLRGCTAKPESQSVIATFSAADGTIFDVEISMQCLPITITALHAELGKLAAALPDHTQKQQPLVVTGAACSMNSQGNVALTVQMENKSELVMEFRKSDLANLAAIFSELAQLANREKPH